MSSDDGWLTGSADRAAFVAWSKDAESSFNCWRLGTVLDEDAHFSGLQTFGPLSKFRAPSWRGTCGFPAVLQPPKGSSHHTLWELSGALTAWSMTQGWIESSPFFSHLHACWSLISGAHIVPLRILPANLSGPFPAV